MDRNINDIYDLSKEIESHAFEKHISEFKDLGISGHEELLGHINKTLTDDHTRCFKVDGGYEPGTMYFYNDHSNTMIVVPGDLDKDPTCYRPKDKEDHFKLKIEKAEKQGLEVEIKQGVHELLPELQQEQSLAEERNVQVEKEERFRESADEMRKEQQAEAEMTEWEQLRAERLAQLAALENDNSFSKGREAEQAREAEEREQNQRENARLDPNEQAREEQQARTEMTEWEIRRAERFDMMEKSDRNATENLDHSRSDYERENERER